LARKRDRYSMHPKAAHTSQGAHIHPKTRAHTSQGSAGIPYSSVHIRTNSLRDLLQANRGTAIFQVCRFLVVVIFLRAIFPVREALVSSEVIWMKNWNNCVLCVTALLIFRCM
jgi:hypothetical protein